MLANPVSGRIQPGPEPWLGSPNFRVTSSFAEHAASGRGLGIDLGNGRCNDPVFAMEAGTVSLADYLGAALVVRIVHPGLSQFFSGQRIESGYAHLTTKLVSNGQVVARGQQIGTIGMTGATACHLHGGFTVAGVETDWWPLLDQNIQGDDVPSPLAVYQPANITIGGAPLTNGLVPARAAPSLSATAEYLLTPNTGAVLLTIGQVPSPDGNWYAYWDVPKGKWLYINASNVPIRRALIDPTTLPPPPPPGLTQEQVDQAIADAVADALAAQPAPAPAPANVEAAKAALALANTALTSGYTAATTTRSKISTARSEVTKARLALG